MSNDRRASSHNTITVDDDQFRDIQVLTPPSNPSHPRSQAWETSSHRSTVSDATNSSENFTTVSREFNALVLAGSAFTNNRDSPSDVVETPTPDNRQLDMIGEGEEETNPLAIVVDNQPLNSPAPAVSVQRVKKDEVEAKISAWQNAKVAKINNRFKREDAVIHGWENEQIQKATSAMKKIERKLEEKRAKAMEKMQNEIAKAHRKAEERRASSEAKKGTKVARVLELANLMRAVGKPPTKRSFF